MYGKSRIDWKVRAMPRATIALGRSPTRLWPSKVMRPLSGRLRPVTALKNVVLPAPLGPISPMMAPRGTTRSTSLSAITPPNFFTTPRTSSSGAPSRAPPAIRSRSQPGMVSTRGGGALAITGSSSSGTAAGRTRRPSRP